MTRYDEEPPECSDDGYDSAFLASVIDCYREKKIPKELFWYLEELEKKCALLEQKIRWIMDWVPSSDKKIHPLPGECPFFTKHDVSTDYKGAKERWEALKRKNE